MKQSLWNSEELCKAINGKSNSNAFWDAYSISLDSRKVKKGGVFSALFSYIFKYSLSAFVEDSSEVISVITIVG